MNDKIEKPMNPNNAEFQIVFGWLTALSVTIASWASLN